MPRNITAIDSTRREMPDSVRSNVSCAFCSRWRILTDNSSMTPMASAWLASMVLRNSSVRIASCSVSLAIPSRSATVRACSRCQRHALQIVVGEVGHRGDGLLDRLGVPAGVLGGGRGARQIIGVGGDQHGRERLAGFAERRPDLRVAMPGGALDDRVQPGHFPGRAQHLLLIGLGDGGLHGAQFAEAVEETVGDVFEPLDRPRQHRVVGGARGQGAEHRFAQQQDLGEQVGARLVDVAMDQVLQPAGFAFQQRQDLVGLPHLPDVVPGRTQHLGAVPDQHGEHHDDGGVQCRDRQDAPADRHRAQPLHDAKTAARGEARRPFRCAVLLRCAGQSFASTPRRRAAGPDMFEAPFPRRAGEWNVSIGCPPIGDRGCETRAQKRPLRPP